MQPVLVVVPECLRYDSLHLLVVGKVVRSDELALQGSVKHPDAVVLLRCMSPDELAVNT